MKLVVKKYVYVRTGHPSTTARFSGYRVPGDVIGVDVIRTGTEIDGNSVWYRCDDDGCYYWSGAFDLVEEQLDTSPIDSFTQEDQFLIYQSAVNDLNRYYSAIPGYRGMAAGYKILEKSGVTENRIALIFYVSGKTPPEESRVGPVIYYRGLALITDFRSIEEVSLLTDNMDRTLPYLMGGSIGYFNLQGIQKRLGSRSLIVEKGEEKYLLTCYHVACAPLFSRGTYQLKKESVTVHLPFYENQGDGVEILKGSVKEGKFSGYFDYALIQTDTSKLRNAMPGHSFANTFYSYADLHSLTKTSRFIKYGSKSRQTSGYFKALHINNYEIDTGRNLYMSGLIEIEMHVEKGDSGAPVIDADGKLLGMLVARTKYSNGSISGLVLPFAQLKEHLYINPVF